MIFRDFISTLKLLVFSVKKNYEKNAPRKWNTKAKKLMLKTQHVFGYFHYKGLICTYSNVGNIQYDLFGRCNTLVSFRELDINSRRKYLEFRKELIETFYIRLGEWDEDTFINNIKMYGCRRIIHGNNQYIVGDENTCLELNEITCNDTSAYVYAYKYRGIYSKASCYENLATTLYNLIALKNGGKL